MLRIEEVITHRRPHLDEIAAFWLLRKFGEEHGFSVPGDTRITFWQGDEMPEGMTADDYEDLGTLLIGIGGGRFDEHPNGDGTENGKKAECAATLVAEALGVSDHPGLGKILQFVLTEDKKGGSHPLGLPALIKSLHAQNPESPMDIMNWAITALEAKFVEQMQFVQVCAKEFAEKADVKRIAVGNRMVTIAVIESDHEQMAKFARSELGCEASIVIIKHPLRGNVQIYTDKRSMLDIKEIVKAVRLEEQILAGDVRIGDWSMLTKEGKLDGVPEWYFHQTGQMLLNGSLTAPNVPATIIPLERIKELVIVAISVDGLPNHCRSGRCIDFDCRWYPYTLYHCRARQQMQM